MLRRMLVVAIGLVLFCSVGSAHAQTCCKCNHYDTDIECAMACNSMAARCQPQIPRPTSASNLVGYCCAAWMSEGAFKSAHERLPNQLPRRTPCEVRQHLGLYGKTMVGEACR